MKTDTKVKAECSFIIKVTDYVDFDYDHYCVDASSLRKKIEGALSKSFRGKLMSVRDYPPHLVVKEAVKEEL